MSEKEIINETKPEEQQKESVDVFLEAAKKVKEDTVPKAEYDKVVADNKKLADYILEGGDGDKPQEQVKERTKAELLGVLENEDSNNLEYTKAALELRQKVIDEGGRDPFLPNSSQQPITSVDVEGAEKVAQVLQECVDECGGDPATFNFLFDKRVKDSSPLLNAAVKARARGK